MKSEISLEIIILNNYFLVNNYHLIKKDNKLDILFDNYIFRYINIV